MRRTTEQMIQESVNAGYELSFVGYGEYDQEVINDYREDGYDVRYWYIPSDNPDYTKYLVYIKKRVRRSKSEVIEQSIQEGYVILAEGQGCYDDEVAKYRNLGYDVRAWYISNTRSEHRNYLVLGKQKVRTKRVKKETVDYTKLTVKELRKICSAKKIPNYSKLSKAEIVSKLTAAC